MPDVGAKECWTASYKQWAAVITLLGPTNQPVHQVSVLVSNHLYLKFTIAENGNVEFASSIGNLSSGPIISKGSEFF